MAAGAVSAGAAYLFVPAIATFPTATPSAGAAASLVALGVGGTGVAFLIYFTLIARVGPARASVVAYLAPGFAVLYGVTLRDEVVTAWTLVGLALVLGGSWLASVRTRRRVGVVPAPSDRGAVTPSHFVTDP
jgi:drug/metabolite transporter (DMT)-like permease